MYKLVILLTYPLRPRRDIRQGSLLYGLFKLCCPRRDIRQESLLYGLFKLCCPRRDIRQESLLYGLFKLCWHSCVCYIIEGGSKCLFVIHCIIQTSWLIVYHHTLCLCRLPATYVWPVPGVANTIYRKPKLWSSRIIRNV